VEDRRRLRRGLRLFLEGVGRSRLGREFERTVDRVTQAWCDELLCGYTEDPDEILTPIPGARERGWVVARRIPFHSMCVHHLLPFFGEAHIAFVPGRSLVGISKLARIVDCFARRLQIQEVLTRQLLDAVQGRLKPKGAAVVIEAEHLCMAARGARSRGTRVLTAAFSGVLDRDPGRREAVRRLIGRSGRA
jgi:GTP cyclohydrolase I